MSVSNDITKCILFSNERLNWPNAIFKDWSTYLDDFTERSSGNILPAEMEEPVKERNYEQKIAEEKRTRLSQTLMVICLPLFLLAAAIFAFINAGSLAVLPHFMRY